jgi:hypothetical protein
MAHKIVYMNDIKNSVTKDPDCDVIIVSSSWGDAYVNHYLNNIQRNHKLC